MVAQQSKQPVQQSQQQPGKRQPRKVIFGPKVRKKLTEGSVFGPYLLKRMEEAEVTIMRFCRLVDHMYVEKFRNIVRDTYRGDLPTWQLVQFADITRSDPVEMVFQYMHSQNYWKGRPEEEVRAKAVTAYLLEIVPKLRPDQQEALYDLVKVMGKQQGIVK